MIKASVALKSKYLRVPTFLERALQLLEAICVLKLGMLEGSEVPNLVQQYSIQAATLVSDINDNNVALTEYAKSIDDEDEIEFIAFLEDGKCIFVGCVVGG